MRSALRPWAAALLVLALLASAAMVLEARPVDPLDTVELEMENARRLLISGRTREAVQAYESLYERHPEDGRVLWALVKAYSSAGMIRDGVVPLLTARVEAAPGDIRALNVLAESHAKLGEHDRAHEEWGRVLTTGRPTESEYAEIGQIELRYRMYEHAVLTLEEGRRKLGSDTLFSQELASAYASLGEYERAIDECLVTVKLRPGFVHWATNRIELMLEEGARKEAVETRMEDIVESEEATEEELSLAGSVFLAIGRYDDALGSYVRADDLSGRDGRVLMEYALLLEDAGLLPEARGAYLLVVEKHPDTSSGAVAGVNSARILAELGDAEGAVAELKSASASLSEAPSSTGAEALLEAARIELDVLRRPEDALATLSGLPAPAGRRQRHMAGQAGLIEIGANLALGRLEEARERAAEILESDARGEVRLKAMYDLGFTSFLKKETRSALSEFRAMVEADVSGRLVNDALRLMLVISDAEEFQTWDAIGLFADAHAARLAGDEDAARQHLVALADHHGGTQVAVEALMLLGQLAEEAGDLRGGLEVYARVLEATESLPAQAEALMRRGDILHHGMGKPEDAVVEYARILEKLPPCALSGEARRKIERIRHSGGIEG